MVFCAIKKAKEKNQNSKALYMEPSKSRGVFWVVQFLTFDFLIFTFQ